MKRTTTTTPPPSSLSVVDHSARAVTTEGGGANTCSNGTGSYHSTPNSLDFVGNSAAVKGLFSLPYATDRPISVAVHNIGGTLLLDSDPEQEVGGIPAENATKPIPRAPPSARPLSPKDEKSKQTAKDENLSRSLVALSTLGPTSEALSLVNTIIDSNHNQSSSNGEELETNVTLSEKTHASETLGIPQPDEYISHFIPPVPEPREYFNWKFHNMNLLVGSDALIYRAPDASTALAVRLEDAEEMRTLSRRHQEMMQSGEFVADHQYAKLQQMGKASYAETTRRNIVQQIEEGKEAEDLSQKAAKDSKPPCFAAPDLDQVQLQTCIVPAPNTPIGALITGTRTESGMVRLEPGSTESRSVSPVSAVLDTYLDNIMANVPQLALCLQEKGFVQSVKLLDTDQIPSSLLDPSTIDTTVPFEAIKGGKPSERIFSPEIMEMNAGTLLRFLKTQCTKDSATYLLRREAGQTNIQLYDISAQSAQSQQKWKWWLATMSYRFACRLRSLESAAVNKVLRREFRARQRNLLLNTLDLLDTLADMNGISHESLISAINENLADSYLTSEDDDDRLTAERSSKLSPATFVASRQPYPNASVDALGKAQDYFVEAIRVLNSTLEDRIKQARRRKNNHRKSLSSSRVVVVSVHSEDDSSSESDDEYDEKPLHSPAIDPVAIQLFGTHHKLVNVSLRLAEIHLGNYYSSSAMQALRVAARRLADSAYLVQLVEGHDREVQWIRQLQLQYTWLWEHCGHFARSFAADELWRDRGHASGEDVISVLQDVDTALRSHHELATDKESFSFFTNSVDSLAKKSKGSIAFNSLNGVVGYSAHIGKALPGSSLTSAGKILSKQGILKREQRRVLVAACLAYGRAIDSFKGIVTFGEEEDPSQATLLSLLRQRLGDACNETGKAMMDAVRNLIPDLTVEGKTDDDAVLAADPLLCSAEFWFIEGLEAFEACTDLRNLALLRCNLCQCCKLRANSIFAKDEPTHAETCLQEAANHLQAAHEALDQRDTDPMTWDMVSDELAATLLVLGVRRRQSLIGSGNLPVILHALRLSPGKERSIVDPMERALNIYKQLSNQHQAAATHYQLALFYSKIWTCQRDEVKTREKLASAFQHYTAAHGFFSQNVRGNETTFCVLCLDLSNLYSSVSGEEFLTKALLCCLDTSKAFAPELVEAATGAPSSNWLDRMTTLSTEVEERVFKILRNLVKMEDTSRTKDYKELYRTGLQAKMKPTVDDENANATLKRLLQVHALLETLYQQYNKEI